MFHPLKNLLISVSLLLLISGCGQKGPLFLAKKTNMPSVSAVSSTENNERENETQQPENINNINAD